MQWLLKRLHLSGVKEDSMQEIIKVSISNDVTSDLKDDESSKTFSNSAHEISKPESDNVSENMDDDLTAVEKNKLSHGNDLEQKHWIKHRLPYIPDMRNKLTNSETLAIVHSSIEIYSRGPQACRKDAVFLINTKSIKDLDDAKSDLKEPRKLYFCVTPKNQALHGPVSVFLK